MELPELRVKLPDWIREFIENNERAFTTAEDRMRFVVELARRNVEQQTGGPFGAAIFDAHGLLVAPGVNLVVRSHCSVLHAEMTAIMLAQQRLGRFDISDGAQHDYELVTSTEPCAMCFGAIPWSGVSRIVCGARDADARAIGFDEGPKLPDWKQALESRNISVVLDVLRDEAALVLQQYARQGGNIYNAGNRSAS